MSQKLKKNKKHFKKKLDNKNNKNEISILTKNASIIHMMNRIEIFNNKRYYKSNRKKVNKSLFFYRSLKQNKTMKFRIKLY